MSDAGATSWLTKGSAGVGAALDIGVYGDTVRAFIGNGNLQAGGNVQVLATSIEHVDSITAALDEGQQGGAGVGGSICTDTVTPTVQAFVQGTVSTPQSLYVNAADSPTIAVLAGGAAGGATKGIGGSILNLNTDPTVDAYIGSGANVTAGGAGTGLFDPGGSGFGGNGITLQAAETDQVLVYASGVAESAANLGVAASAIVDTMSSDIEAYVASGATVNGSSAGANSAQSVLVRAEQSTTILSVADDFGNAEQVGVGAGADVEVIDRTIKAYLAPSATVNAHDNVVLAATSTLDAGSIVAGTGGTLAGGTTVDGNLDIDGSLARLSFSTTTLAFIDAGAVVTAQNNVSLAADRSTTIATNIGAETFDSAVGAGFSNSSVFSTDDTEAFVASGASVLANGNGAAISVLTGQRDSDGNELTTPINGVSITATSYEDIAPVSAGSPGQAGAAAGVAASTTFTLLNEKTLAYVEHGATINSSLAVAAPAQVVNLLASDTTFVASLAGTDTSGQFVGVGAGADIGSITKDTEAYIAGLVNAAQNVLVQSLSQEWIASQAASNAVDFLVSIAAGGSVYTLNATTKAYVGDGATVFAAGNILVASNDADHLNLIDDLSHASEIASVGASLGVAVVSKVTEAYIGDATVNAEGNAPGLAADSGAFTIQFVPDTPQPGKVSPPGINFVDSILNGLLHIGGLPILSAC